MRLTTIVRTWRSAGFTALLALPVMFGALITTVGCATPDTEYCSDDDDCARIVGPSEFGSICHPSQHVCISGLSCRTDEDCLSPDASRCDIATNRCQPCLPDDISDVSCRNFSDRQLCAKKPSGASGCVTCLANIDCPANAPICDGQSCRKCQRHSDCEGSLHCDDGSTCVDSMVCMNDVDFGAMFGGRCAKNGDTAAGRVVYVMNDPAVCSSGASGVEIDHPLCSFEEGVTTAVTTQRPYVRVIAKTPYVTPFNWSVKSGQLIFVGSPSKSRGDGQAALLDFSPSMLSVSEAGNVTFDGFAMTQRFNARLFRCFENMGLVPALTLRNNVVRGQTLSNQSTGTAAVELVNCRAHIHNNVIGVTSLTELQDPNHQAHSRVLNIASSSSIPGTSYLIENNVIAGNWDNAVDLNAVETPGVMLRFNTIYGNDLRSSLIKTIRCSSFGPYVTIAQSIVMRAPPMTGNLFEYASNCRFKQVVVGTQAPELTDAELIRDTPQFEGNFELNSSNNSCCIDRAQPSASDNFPSTDLALRSRPQGAGYDLGAFEVVVKR